MIVDAEKQNCSPTPQSAQAERLKEAAYTFARGHGLATLSARSLSKETGMRPAAINYYFGNRDLLISEIGACAIEESRQWRKTRAVAFQAEAPVWADLPDIFTGLLQARLSDCRHVLALLQELDHETADQPTAEIRTHLINELRDEAEFWRGVALHHGESRESAELWANLALGLISLMLPEADPSRRSPWLTAAAERLRRRQLRQPVAPMSSVGPDPAQIAAGSPTNATAQAILSTALAVIAEKGPERLVQREVASRAGVALASVTYFFRTKSDLISAAFAELCRRHTVMIAHAGQAAHDTAMSVEDRLAFQDAESLSGMAAMDALLRASVRAPELAQTAALIRRARGVAAIVLLRKLKMAVDHIDAYLWSCMLSGRYRLVRYGQPELQAEMMMNSAHAMLKTLFDLPHQTGRT